MKVHKVKLLPLSALRASADNPKKPMGRRYSDGLKASLEEFGFAGIFNVAANADDSFQILDGNTRANELEAAGVAKVPCIVHDDMAEGAEDWRGRRTLFSLAFDRHRKLFDEDAVVERLRELATGRDLAHLGRLSGVENLRQVVDHAQREAKEKTQAALGKQAACGSLVLYGPTEDIEAVQELIKKTKGRLGPVFKLRQNLEQADAFLDLTDEQFLLAFASALERIGDAS